MTRDKPHNVAVIQRSQQWRAKVASKQDTSSGGTAPSSNTYGQDDNMRDGDGDRSIGPPSIEALIGCLEGVQAATPG